MTARISNLGIFLLILSLGFSNFTTAQPPIRESVDAQAFYIANPNIHSLYHDKSNVGLSVHNWGMIGNGSLSSSAPEWPPSLRFPIDSNIEYLSRMGVWIGALIQEEGYEYPRVSTGEDGWFGTNELYPGESINNVIQQTSNIPGEIGHCGVEMYSSSAISPQEFTAIYTDTLTETFWVYIDPIDGPHVPLGVKIKQKSMVWDAFGFDDIVIFQFTIENIGDKTLKNPYIGMLVDSEVGNDQEFENRWLDDIVGFLSEVNGDTWNIAYWADNDGRYHEVGSGSDLVAPSVVGVFTPQSELGDATLSANWWITSGYPDDDFGPSWQSHVESLGGEWTALYGTPVGDMHKYWVMSNREIDYDQLRVNDPGWISNHPQQFFDESGNLIEEQPWHIPDIPNSFDIANGYNTYFLISWGPLGENTAISGQPPETYLNPGESFTFAFALVCGEGFHDVNNPQPSNEIIDPALFAFDDLVYNAESAKIIIDSDFQVIPPHAPEGFQVGGSYESFLGLTWHTFANLPNTRVNIFRRTEGAEYGNTPINPAPVTALKYVDNDIITGTRYFYKAQAVRYDTMFSYFSDEITIVAGAPISPTGLVAQNSQNGCVPLYWNPYTRPNLLEYRIYRKDSSSSWQLVGTSAIPEYVDSDVTNGLEYSYAVSIVNTIPLESELSDSVTAIPMGFYSELLMVIYQTGGGFFEWNDDSINTYYQTLCDDIDIGADFIFQWDTTSFPTLDEISPYTTLWIIDDSRKNRSGFVEQHNHRNQVMESYLSLGGNVIMSGRRLFLGFFGMHEGFIVQSRIAPILNDWFAIEEGTGSNWPSYPGSNEFIAAEPTDPQYPYLEVDSIKLMYMEGPGNLAPLEIDVMTPSQLGVTFYTYVSIEPDSSLFHGHATGIRYDSTTAIMTFPLYAMKPYDSIKILVENILDYVRGSSIQHPSEPLHKPAIPLNFTLYQNYPNPFNVTTTIPYAMPTDGYVTITLYNISGRRIATLVNGWRDPGIHRVIFNASALSSGLYFYQLRVEGFTAVKKMVLLK